MTKTQELALGKGGKGVERYATRPLGPKGLQARKDARSAGGGKEKGERANWNASTLVKISTPERLRRWLYRGRKGTIAFAAREGKKRQKSSAEGETALTAQFQGSVDILEGEGEKRKSPGKRSKGLFKEDEATGMPSRQMVKGKKGGSKIRVLVRSFASRRPSRKKPRVRKRRGKKGKGNGKDPIRRRNYRQNLTCEIKGAVGGGEEKRRRKTLTWKKKKKKKKKNKVESP